ELGLERTFVPEDCRTLLDRFAIELGFERLEDLSSQAALEALAADPDGWARRTAATSVIAPRDTNQSTPREVTRLLQLIWLDQAGPAEACAQVRAVMGKQLFSHRLPTGFPGEVAVAAKTGTLPFLKNEAGVVTYPDGGRYAVAVFTRGRVLDARQPDQDRVIGTVARIAVDHLRQVAGLPTDVSLHATR
ncbi:MAG TPA: serine hydrolase, partial [Nitriliruptorales bacterium]